MERLLVEFTVRATLIAATVAVVIRVLRIQTAAAQHTEWKGVLVAMLVLPVWISWGPKEAVPLPPRGEQVVLMTTTTASGADQAPVVSLRPELPRPVAPLTGNWSVMWIGIYLTGAGVLLLRLTIGTLRANRLTSTSCAAPVTVGLFRPRAILPESSTEWPAEQLDAVLAHEREHVRRRDPLTQWIALFNRAVFWLAWWLERRLSSLAEEACDAAVLDAGHDPADYSRYLLELARAVQRAGMRVDVAGMAMPGSYLPQRIRKIAAGVTAPHISRSRMATATAVCLVCSTVFAAGKLEPAVQIQFPPLPPLRTFIPVPVMRPAPVLLAQATAVPVRSKPLTFDVASVKPAIVPPGVTVLPGGGMVVGRGSGIRPPRDSGGPGTDDPGRIHYPLISLKSLLRRAYDSYFEIKGPDWLDSQLVQIDATMPVDTSKEQFNEMLRNLTRERFQLQFHVETKDVTGYALTVTRSGSKMKRSEEVITPVDAAANSGLTRQIGPDGFPVVPSYTGPGFRATAMMGERARMSGQQKTMQDLADTLGQMLNSRVSDATGLTAKYDITLTFAGHLGPGGVAPADASTVASDPAGLADLFGALQSQLGLKLEPKKVPVTVMVVDHMERVPAGN